MISVSFSSAEDALSNDVKKKYITLLARKVLKIRRSTFLGTPGIGLALGLGLGLGLGLTLAYVTAAISATANVAEAIKINIKTILSSRDHDQRSCCVRGVQLGACSISKLTQPQVYHG